jgi:hypothetical protein
MKAILRVKEEVRTACVRKPKNSPENSKEKQRACGNDPKNRDVEKMCQHADKLPHRPMRCIIRAAMKMEFDSEQIHRYLKLIKSLEGEVLAYRSVYEFVRDSERFSVHELVSRLTEAKAAVQQEMDSKYDEALQMLADITDQASANRALEFLANWPSKGRPN